MVSSILTACVLYGLFLGQLPTPFLLVFSLGAGLLFLRTHHTHSGISSIDVLARRSALCKVAPALKVGCSLLVLMLCIAAQTALMPLTLTVVLCAVTIGIGGISWHDYLSKFSLPAVFLLLSTLALLWNFTPERGGLLDLPFFGGYLSILPTAQTAARLVLARALGAMSCLFFLSLSTPMPELLAVLRRAHVPAVVTDLAVLIYRYIFLLFATYHEMHAAAQSRLGFSGLRRSLRTTGQLYALLLANSFRKASACFDAMESRCCTGELRFLTRPKPIRVSHALFAGFLVAGSALMTLLSYR